MSDAISAPFIGIFKSLKEITSVDVMASDFKIPPCIALVCPIVTLSKPVDNMRDKLLLNPGVDCGKSKSPCIPPTGV